MSITKNWKNILSIGLAVLVLFGAVGAVASFATNDSKPAGAVFKVGGLDPETGKYVDTDKTIYTETAIDAYGLRVEPDFESTVTYDIYYYDNEDKLLSVVEGQTEVYDEDFEVASKCRIVIHPEIPEDVKERDFKIRFWEVAKYARVLDIKNSIKSSKYGDFTNLFDDKTALRGYSILEENEGSFNLPAVYASSKVSDKIEIGEICYVDVYLKFSIPPQQSLHILYIDKNGEAIAYDADTMYYYLGDVTESHFVKVTFEIPENAVEMRFEMPYDAQCYIYGYND